MFLNRFQFMRRGPEFYRQVAVLAAPIILQNLITSTLGMADIFMVGMLGELPMAAVTLANIPLFVLQLFLFGIQSGASVLISQYWGKQDPGAINRVLGVALLTAGVSAFLWAFTLWCFPVQFLSLFGGDPEVVALAAQYGQLAGLAFFLNSFSLVYLAAFRAMESPRLGMYVLAASMCTNTFLNWVLIFGKLGFPAMGVRGAALATLIARGLEVALVLGHAGLCRSFPLRLSLILRPGGEMARRFFRVGGPVVCNEALWGLGTALFPTIMGHMAGSTEILAAYAIVSNMERLFHVAAMGMAATASILIGREIGAGRQEQVYSVGLALNTLAAGIGMGLGGVLMLFNLTLAPGWLFPLFRLSPGAQEVAALMLTLLALTMPCRDFNTTNIVGVLRGGGDVQAATLIDLIPLWLLAIPLSALCGLGLKAGIFWVALSMATEQVGKLGAGIWRLRSGKWIHDLTRPEGLRKEEFL